MNNRTHSSFHLNKIIYNQHIKQEDVSIKKIAYVFNEPIKKNQIIKERKQNSTELTNNTSMTLMTKNKKMFCIKINLKIRNFLSYFRIKDEEKIN